MSGSAIFWPVIVLAVVTLGLYVFMFRARMTAVRRGDAKMADFRLRTHESQISAPFVNAITNQYETPVLYYAVCIIAFVVDAATPLMVVLAWLYCLAKLAHVWVFVNGNRLKLRIPAFSAAYGILFVMWLVLAIMLALG